MQLLDQLLAEMKASLDQMGGILTGMRANIERADEIAAAMRLSSPEPWDMWNPPIVAEAVAGLSAEDIERATTAAGVMS